MMKNSIIVWLDLSALTLCTRECVCVLTFDAFDNKLPLKGTYRSFSYLTCAPLQIFHSLLPVNGRRQVGGMFALGLPTSHVPCYM